MHPTTTTTTTPCTHPSKNISQVQKTDVTKYCSNAPGSGHSFPHVMTLTRGSSPPDPVYTSLARCYTQEQLSILLNSINYVMTLHNTKHLTLPLPNPSIFVEAIYFPSSHHEALPLKVLEVGVNVLKGVHRQSASLTTALPGGHSTPFVKMTTETDFCSLYRRLWLP